MHDRSITIHKEEYLQVPAETFHLPVRMEGFDEQNDLLIVQLDKAIVTILPLPTSVQIDAG